VWKVVALLGFMGSPAVAQTDQDVEFCTGYGTLAADIMTHRQNGTLISTVLGVLTKTKQRQKPWPWKRLGPRAFTAGQASNAPLMISETTLNLGA
jgi:hypothetical protein